MLTHLFKKYIINYLESARKRSKFADFYTSYKSKI